MQQWQPAAAAQQALWRHALRGAAATSCFFNLRLCAGPRAPETDAQRAMGGVVVDVDVDGQQAVRHGSPKAGVLRGRRRTAALFSFAQSREAPPARRNRLHLPAAAWVVCSSCSSPKPGERHVESVNDFFPLSDLRSAGVLHSPHIGGRAGLSPPTVRPREQPATHDVHSSTTALTASAWWVDGWVLLWRRSATAIWLLRGKPRAI